jgi:DNA protecting protein DprA
MAEVQTQLEMDIGDVEQSITTSDFGISLLALSGIKGLGTKGISALFDGFYGDLGRVWRADPENLKTILQKKKIPNTETIINNITTNYDRLLERGMTALSDLKRDNIHVIPLGQLPQPLQGMSDPPRWLFVEGNPEALFGRPSIAVVGTRQSSDEGIRATNSIVRVLSAYPVTLISGLAEGIDAQAHWSSLSNNIPNVAFLGHGIRLIFPRETQPIRRAIVEQGGAVASEYLPGEGYRKSTFVERNRLQAALANIVIPVEANAQSGTAHTVRFARQYKKPLIGIRWEGANGILTELENDGDTIVDIFTREGRRVLDGNIRALADKVGASTYALKLGEECLMREIRTRAVRRSDFETLIANLQAELERIESSADA